MLQDDCTAFGTPHTSGRSFLHNSGPLAAHRYCRARGLHSHSLLGFLSFQSHAGPLKTGCLGTGLWILKQMACRVRSTFASSLPHGSYPPSVSQLRYHLFLEAFLGHFVPGHPIPTPSVPTEHHHTTLRLSVIVITGGQGLALLSTTVATGPDTGGHTGCLLSDKGKPGALVVSTAAVPYWVSGRASCILTEVGRELSTCSRQFHSQTEGSCPA